MTARNLWGVLATLGIVAVNYFFWTGWSVEILAYLGIMTLFFCLAAIEADVRDSREDLLDEIRTHMETLLEREERRVRAEHDPS